MPIGYTDEDDLMIMRKSGGKFQVVQIGDADDPAANSHIVLDDVAPGAVALCDQALVSAEEVICDSSIALAPQGKSLVVAASYSDGSRHLLSVDLHTGKRVQVSNILAQTHTHVELVGWDRVGSGI